MFQYESSSPSAEAIRQLLDSVGLNHPLELCEIERMMEAAAFNGTAYTEQRELIGYIRVLSDGVFNGFISDLAVSPEFQRRGIGKTLVALATDPQGQIKYVVMPTLASLPFWKACQFEVVTAVYRARVV